METAEEEKGVWMTLVGVQVTFELLKTTPDIYMYNTVYQECIMMKRESGEE